MPIVLREPCLLFAVCLILAASAAINTATAQTKPAQTQPKTTQADTTQTDPDDQNTPDTADDELEAAAVTIDVSHSAPVLQTRPAEAVNNSS